MLGAFVTLAAPSISAGAVPTPNPKVAFIGDHGNNANSLAVLNLIKSEART